MPLQTQPPPQSTTRTDLPVVVLGVEDEVDGDDGGADRDDEEDEVHQRHEVVDKVEPDGLMGLVMGFGVGGWSVFGMVVCVTVWVGMDMSAAMDGCIQSS